MSLPVTLPLVGTHLIEASAGTGKTYTLAALYVRLVLGAGTTAFPQGLATDQILVLTFTRAATRELRQRIRERLTQTAACLQGDGTVAANDDFLQSLLLAPAKTRQVWAERAERAARHMDCATIYTIHGYCQRALKRFAFAAGQPFEQVLRQDTQELVDEIWRDYWRRFIQPLPAALVDTLLGFKITDPIALKKAAPQLAFVEPVKPADALPGSVLASELAFTELAQAKEQARQALLQQKDALDKWLDEMAWALNKKKYTAKAMQALHDFIRTGCHTHYLALFTPTGLTWNAGKAQEIASSLLPALNALATYVTLHDKTDFPLDELLNHASHWVGATFETRLDANAEITYDSMITGLMRALKSAHGTTLATQLRATWPAALIDEFQDTDANQYEIFRQVYGNADASQSCWLLIGDPKQSIYGWRGADIQAYLAAAASVPTGQQHNLDKNFRSAAGLVEAVNQLFATSPLTAEAGGVFGESGIPFHAVHANGIASRFEVHAEPATPLTLCHLLTSETLAKAAAVPELAQHFARRIAHLLILGQQQQAGFRQPDGTLHAVRPQDITLLVRNRDEANAMQTALLETGVSSVYLANRESIFQSAEAQDLHTLLMALAHPQSGQLLHRALVIPLLKWSLPELLAMQAEGPWQILLQQADGLRLTWEKHGPLPMLMRLLQEWKLAERQPSERTLTNLLHLAELLQTASQSLVGLDAQVQWLAAAIRDSAHGNEDNPEHQPRLESERELVQIVTLHGSKGLEYPLVFLPFVCLAPGKSDNKEANDDMRLLYVGMTRARHACWLGLIDNKHGTSKLELKDSCLGRLLFGTTGLSTARLATLAALSGIIVTTDAPPASVYQAEAPEPLLPAAPPLATRLPRGWTVTSYSRLNRQRGPDAFSATDERLLEEQEDATTLFTTAQEPVGIHAFPRGAAAGNLLHSLLEKTLAPGFDADRQQALAACVAAHCQLPIYVPYRSLLTQWIDALIHTPLPFDGTAITLTQLTPRLMETGFWLKLDDTQTTALDALAGHLLPGPRPALESRAINGMLRGFIDLTFCHAGRYYVLDYKSNWLGTDAHAYTRDNMRAAMLEHRYELQALIYQQALHRLLRERLPDYDPARHLGGCLYFFLRGIDGPERGLVHLPANPALLEKVEQLMCGEPA